MDEEQQFCVCETFDSYTSKVSSEIENATVVYDSTETAVSDTTADEETSSTPILLKATTLPMRRNDGRNGGGFLLGGINCLGGR
jgi:hypothetical protein